MNLPDQILRMVEKLIEELIRQRVDIHPRHFGFMPGYDTMDVIFIFRQFQNKYLAKKNKGFVFIDFGFGDLEKAFDQDPRDTVWRA